MPTTTHPTNRAPQDWDRSEVKAQLERAGWSLRQLGFAHGYRGDSSLSEVFRKPWPKVEGLIAAAIGVAPQVVWPSRYHADGSPNRRIGRAPVRPAHLSGSAKTLPHGKAIAPSARNPQNEAA